MTANRSEPANQSGPTSRSGGKSAAAFRTISEVAQELDVPQHVLRFWESKFTHVRPLKRGGGRRYYRPEDVDLLRRIRALLYTEGYTIKGVQRLLRDGQGKLNAATAGPPVSMDRKELRAVIEELSEGQRRRAKRIAWCAARTV
jgi:DNA-binding transcriptional MerR regulator